MNYGRSTLLIQKKMRVYERNLSFINPCIEKINYVLECDILEMSHLLGKALQYKIDIGIIKDNNEFIKVTKVLNSLGIGVIPYEYKYAGKRYINTDRRGFTHIITNNIIYININIHTNLIQIAALHEFIHVIKYLNYDVYINFLSKLQQDDTYVTFCKSEIHQKALEEVNCPKDKYEDELLANFYTLNPDNRNIPFAFFYQMNFKNSKVELPPNQQKYLDMLLEVAGKIVMSDE